MHKLTYISFFIFVCFGVLALIPASIHAQLMLSEVMPDPYAPQDQSEWVEIFNYSDAAQDLSQWKLGDHALGGSDGRLGSQEYLIVTRNKQQYAAEFGEARAIELPISLNNSGGSLSLKKAAEVKDTLSYISSKPGQSWERAGPICDQLYLTELATPGKTNRHDTAECYEQTVPAPKLMVEFSMDSKSWSENLQALGLTPIHFRLLLDGEVQSNVSWSSDGISLANPSTFSGLVQESIQAKFSSSELGELKILSDGLKVYPLLKITEILADPDGSDSGKEWVEIYNPNTFAMNIRELSLQANNKSVEAEVPSEIAAGGYAVIKLRGSVLPNCTNEPECKVNLTLFNNDFELQKLTYGESLPGKSWSLLSNGNWDKQAHPTPGKANDETSLLPKLIAISEIYPSPQSEEEEWLELKNYGEHKVDLEKWELRDSGGKYVFGKQELGPGEYLVVKGMKITLNNSGEELRMYDAGGVLVDKVTYPKVDKGKTVNRKFSGAVPLADVEISDIPTPGRENELSAELVAEEEEKSLPVKAVTSNSSVVANVATQLPAKVYALPSTRINLLPRVESNYDPGKLRWVVALAGFATSAGLVLAAQIVPAGYAWTKRYYAWWWA